MTGSAFKLASALLLAAPILVAGLPAMAQFAPPPEAPQKEERKVTNRQEWLGHLQDRLNRTKRLPEELRETLKPGSYKVMLGFTVDAAGQVSNIAVQESSGQAGLDAAAQETVGRLSPLPAFPADMAQKEQQFRLPMLFVIPEPVTQEPAEAQGGAAGAKPAGQP